MLFFDVFVEAASTQLRHASVCDHEVNGLVVEHLDSEPAIRRLHDVIAIRAQEFGNQRTDGDLVVDDEHGRAPPLARLWRAHEH